MANQESRLAIVIDTSDSERRIKQLRRELRELGSEGNTTARQTDEVSQSNSALASSGIEAERSTSNLSKSLKLAGRAAMGLTAVLGATTALSALAVSTAQADAEMANFARNANVGVEKFQILTKASESLGVSQEQLGQILADTQEKLGEYSATGGGGALDFFEALQNNTNMTTEEIRNFGIMLQGKDGVEAVQIIKDKLDELNLTYQEQRFIMESLGSDAGNLLAIFADGGRILEEYGDALRDAGVIKSKEAIEQSKRLAAQTQAVQLRFEGLKSQLAAQLIPIMSDVIGSFSDGTANAGDFKAVIREVGDTVRWVASGVVGFVYGIRMASTVIKGLLDVAAAAGDTFANFKAADTFTGKLEALQNGTRYTINRVKMLDYDMKGLFARGEAAMDNILNSTISSYDRLSGGIYELNNAQQSYGSGMATNTEQAKEHAKAQEAAAKAAGKHAEAQARLVGISGNTGIGTGAHIDIRYGSADARRHQKPRQEHINRFEVDGTPLGKLRKTSDFNMNRKHPVTGKVRPHYGVDYAAKIGSKITTTVPIKNVKTWFDKKGGGWVSTVTFDDGVQMNLLHLSPASKGIKGGPSSGKYKGAYNQANSLLDKSKANAAREAERAAELERRRLEKQQQLRLKLDKEFADKQTRIAMERDAKIAEIESAGYSDDERDKKIEEAKQRATDEIAIYKNTQDQKLEKLKSFKLSEEDLINQQADWDIENLATQGLSDAQLKQAKTAIEEKRDLELQALKQVQAEQMQNATEWKQTHEQIITNRANLEREKIRNNTKLSEDVKKAEIEKITALENQALKALELERDKQRQQANEWQQSQVDIIKNRAQIERNEIINNSKLSEDVKQAELARVDALEIQSLQRLAFERDKQYQNVASFRQTEAERIKNQYALERREIELTVTKDTELREAKLLASKMVEQAHLDALRYQHERELEQLGAYGLNEFESIRLKYKQMREDNDRRTDITPEQKSARRNAITGSEMYELTQARKTARQPFENMRNSMQQESPMGALIAEMAERKRILDEARQLEVINEQEHKNTLMQIERSYMESKRELMLTQGQELFGSLSGIAKSFLGEQSGVYRALFAMQQSFAFASAGINMYKALSDAMATGATMGEKLSAYSVVATEFGNIMSGLNAVNAPIGQAHDGIMSVPKSGTWNLEKGERVLPAQTAKAMDKKLDGASGGNNINITVNVDANGNATVDAKGANAMSKQLAQGIKAVCIETIAKEKRQGGMLYAS